MPTTMDEAQTIVSLVTEYLPKEEALELARRLNEEVGLKTENDSVKVTMQMLYDLFSAV